MKFYAGIGARSTPLEVLNMMTEIAVKLDELGYTLRSGGASGADSAFAKGTNHAEVFRAYDATSKAIEMASQFHPAWERCNDYVRKLHGRNVQILLGNNLDNPVDFVICWTPKGEVVGGTGLGIRLAKAKNIKVYNLYLDSVEFLNFLEKLERQ